MIARSLSVHLEYRYKIARWYVKHYLRMVFRKIIFGLDYNCDSYIPKDGSYKVSPSQINYVYHQERLPIENSFLPKFIQLLCKDYLSFGLHPLRKLDRGMILHGEWETLKTDNKIDKNIFFTSAQERFKDNKTWNQTQYFKYYTESMTDSYSKVDRKKSINQVKKQIKVWDSLYHQISSQGYLSQSELKISTCPYCKYRNARVGICDKCGRNLTKEVLIPSHANYLQLSEIAVHIGRNGEIMLSQGLHRAVYARLLEVSEVYVNIIVRHKIWFDFKNLITKKAESGSILYPLTHVDLQYLPSQLSDKTYKIIKSELSIRSGRMIDLSANWGYFCNIFESTGFECWAYESDKDNKYFMKKLKRAENKKYKILNSLSDETNSKKGFDFALILGISSNFLGSEDFVYKINSFISNNKINDIFLSFNHLGKSKNSTDKKDEIINNLFFGSKILINREIGSNDLGFPIYKITIN